jgi:hypothetical protein
MGICQSCCGREGKGRRARRKRPLIVAPSSHSLGAPMRAAGQGLPQGSARAGRQPPGRADGAPAEANAARPPARRRRELHAPPELQRRRHTQCARGSAQAAGAPPGLAAQTAGGPRAVRGQCA